MSHIIPQRINQNAVPGFYKKVSTAGDASRFVSAETGKRQIQVAANAATVDIANKKYLFSLGFNYIVGAKQLQVFLQVDGSLGTWVMVNDKALAESQDPNYASSTTVFFEEVTENSVRVTNLPSSSLAVMFVIPHTATPAETREKLIVNEQGDNVGIDLKGRNDGVRFRAVDNSVHILRVAPDGTLFTVPNS